MALFYVDIKTFNRSRGQSSVNAAAYRAGASFHDRRTGVTHTYMRKQGVLGVYTSAPQHAPAWARDPEKLWNESERVERKNGRVARELLTALPAELNATQGAELAQAIAQHLVDRYGVAVMTCVHSPDRRGDQRNLHAHLLFTTREVGSEGLGRKTRILDDRKTGPVEVESIRAKVAEITNDHLSRAGIGTRLDHRSLAKQSVAAEERGDLLTAFRLARVSLVHEGQHGTAARRRGEVTEQTLTNDLIRAGNTGALQQLLGEATRELKVAVAAPRPRSQAGVRSRQRPGVPVLRAGRATGADAELLNAEAAAMHQTARVEAELAHNYQKMLDGIVKDLGPRAEAVVDYAQLRVLSAQDLQRLASYAVDPRCGVLLRQVLRAEQSRGHAQRLPSRRRRRYGDAMVRTQQAQRALDTSVPGAPQTRRQWAQLRRRQERELAAAQRSEERARLLIGHEADYRAHARVKATQERIQELEANRRQRFPLQCDASQTAAIAVSDVLPQTIYVPPTSNPRPSASRPRPH